MNGLRNWVLNMLKTHCASQFEAAMGMSVDEMHAACERGDKDVLSRIRSHGELMQKQNPAACQNAAAWAREAFPGAGASVKNKQNNNPIERTQYNELQ